MAHQIDPNVDIAEYYTKKKRESLPHRINEVKGTLNEVFYCEPEDVKGILQSAISLIKEVINDME